MSSERSSQAPLHSLALSGPAGAPRPAVFCFSILAEPEPNVMPRVLELFAKRNMVPERWVSDVRGFGGRAGRELAIDLQVAGLTAAVADYIGNCLRELHYVDRVLISEKNAA